MVITIRDQMIGVSMGTRQFSTGLGLEVFTNTKEIARFRVFNGSS